MSGSNFVPPSSIETVEQSMRRLFWPCFTVLVIFTLSLFASMSLITWASADRNMMVRVQNWRFDVWHGYVTEKFPRGSNKQDTSRGAFHYGPVGFDWRAQYTPPRWTAEIVQSGAFMADGTTPAGSSPIKMHHVTYTRLQVPILYVLGAWLMISFLPTRAWIVHRRRVKRGWCLKCGYDLQGIDENKPCPECGQARSA